jgi:hypothetical protein
LDETHLRSRIRLQIFSLGEHLGEQKPFPGA